MKKYRIAIYALHPITYQTPIFKELSRIIKSRKLDYEVEVLFGDDLSLKNIYYEHLNKEVKFDNDLYLNSFVNKFMMNFSKNPRKGFFSRINPSICSRIILDRYDVVLIHGYETFTSWLTLITAKLLFRRVIFRGEAVLEGNPYKPGITQKIKRVVLPLFFKLCDAVVYSCQGNKRYFEFFGVAGSKLFLLPCAVNNNYFLEQRALLEPKRRDNRKELGISQNELVILFSARFTERKRPYDLIHAVKNTQNSEITILFVGDGPERQSMEKLATDMGVKAIFTGFVGPTELSKYYSISDLDAVISSKDPSPKSLNEALLFSLPIIVTDVVGTAYDLVKDGDNGYIVNVGDIDEISKKISFLAQNPAVRRAMGRVSINIVSSWTLEAGAEGLLSAVNYVLGKS